MGSNLTEGGFKFWQRFYLEMLTGESEEGWREVVTRLDSWFFHTPRHTIFSREGKGLKKLQWSWRLPWWRWWEWKIGTTMMMKMVTPTLRLWEVEKPQLGSEPLFNLISNPDSNIKWWGWLWCGSFLSAIVILKDLVFFSFIWKSHSTTNFDPCGKLRKTSQRSERQVKDCFPVMRCKSDNLSHQNHYFWAMSTHLTESYQLPDAFVLFAHIQLVRYLRMMRNFACRSKTTQFHFWFDICRLRWHLFNIFFQLIFWSASQVTPGVSWLEPRNVITPLWLSIMAYV